MFSGLLRALILIKGLLERASTDTHVYCVQFARRLRRLSANISWPSSFISFSRKPIYINFFLVPSTSSISSKNPFFNRPSTTSEPVSKPSDYDYIEAELIGRDNTRAECEEVFQHCERSILEIFTEIYDNKMFEFV